MRSPLHFFKHIFSDLSSVADDRDMRQIKIGACGSVLTAMIFLRPLHPGGKLDRPLMPKVRISFGFTVRPDKPI